MTKIPNKNILFLLVCLVIGNYLGFGDWDLEFYHRFRETIHCGMTR
jgi:hypothetical protein